MKPLHDAEDDAMRRIGMAAANRIGQEPGEGDLAHDDGGHAAARRQPLDVGTDGGDVEEQPLERAGDGHLPHRRGGLAVDDEQALDADGEVARDGVDPGVQAGQRPHHEAPRGPRSARRDRPPRRDRQRLDARVVRRPAAPHRRTGGGPPQPAPRVAVEQEALQHPGVDEHVPGAASPPRRDCRRRASDGRSGRRRASTTARRSARRRSANGDRPFTTGPPVRVPATRPSTVDATARYSSAGDFDLRHRAGSAAPTAS